MGAASAASFAFMIMGCSRAWSSPGMPKLLESGDVNITTNEASWISSVPPIGSVFGSLAAGPLLAILGRKWTLALISIPYSIGFLLIGFATHPSVMIVGRIVKGFIIGVATPSAQIYIGECASPRVRGALGSFTAIFLALGILITYVIGKYVHWDELAWICGAMPITLLLSMLYMPETPSFLLTKGKEEEAKKSLQFYRGSRTNIEPEFERLRANVMKASSSGSEGIKLSDLKKGSVHKPLLLSMGLMFFQQFSGVNAVIYYTVQIFEAAGSTIPANDATIIVGVVQLIAVVAAMFLVDRAGRRILLLMSGALMAMSLGSLGYYFHIKVNQGEEAASGIGWLPLVSLMVFIVAYSLGYASVPFLIMGELFPTKYRGLLGSLSSCFNLGCTFTVVKSFDTLALNIGYHGAFWLYAISCVVGIVFVFFLLPETKGKALDDIEKMFMHPRKRNALNAVVSPAADEKWRPEKVYDNGGIESEDEEDNSQVVAPVM